MSGCWLNAELLGRKALRPYGVFLTIGVDEVDVTL
jgi:hypothetical protein